MPMYRVHMSQVGHGRLHATVEVWAENRDDAQEAAFAEDIDWKVAKFSGEGYDVDEIEEVDEESCRPPHGVRGQ